MTKILQKSNIFLCLFYSKIRTPVFLKITDGNEYNHIQEQCYNLEQKYIPKSPCVESFIHTAMFKECWSQGMCFFNDISQYGQGKGNTDMEMNVPMTLWAFIHEKNVQREFQYKIQNPL